MKKRILLLALVVAMLLGTFGVSYADDGAPEGTTPPSHTHTYKNDNCAQILAPTEGKNGVLRHYCDTFDVCNGYYDEATPRLPNVYVSKFGHDNKGLCTRITAHQRYEIINGEINIFMEDHNANLIGHQYNYNWQDDIIKLRSIEFKARDVGVGYFNKDVDTYSYSIPLRAVTDCEEDGGVIVYLTTGAAIVRLSEDATAELIEDAEESIGVVVTRDGDEVSAKLLVDEEEVEAPNGVEMLYWVKDAGDRETAPAKVLRSHDYKNFYLKGDFDLIFVESLNGIVNCDK